MKALVLLPAVALTLVLLSASPQGQDWSLHTSQYTRSVFHLESNEGHCSAILVNAKDTVVLTAAHCVPDKVEGRSLAVDEKHADLIRMNTVIDLALLRVPEITGTPVALRSQHVNAGLPVMVVGHGFGALRLKFGFGWISDERDASLRHVGDRLYFAAAGEVPGHSGGALVDADGKLVSVVQGVLYSGPSAFGIGAPRDVVDDFVKPFWPKP